MGGRRDPGPKEAIEDAKLFGIPEAAIAALEGEGSDQAEELGIWPDNIEIVMAFASIASQWRVASIGTGGLHFLGLDYTAVRVALGAQKIRVTPELWAGLMIMETAGRQAANAR